MSSKLLLTVVGATGNQGGSVIRMVLSLPTLKSKYALRGISRDPSKPSSTELSAQGVEMVKADLTDPSSLSSAIAGSHAVFGVTDFWESGSKSSEVQQGKNIADACKTAGVKHLIWSAQPNVTKLTNGTLKNVPHFDGKAEVADYIESIKGDSMLASYYMPGLFMSFIKAGVLPAQDGNGYAWSLPLHPTETQVGLCDVRADTGKYVLGLIEAGKSANGVFVQGVSEWRTPQQMVDAISAESGKTVKFNQLPPEVFSTFLPEASKTELTETMILVRDFSYFGKGAEKKQSESDKYLVAGTKTESWEEFVKANGPWAQ